MAVFSELIQRRHRENNDDNITDLGLEVEQDVLAYLWLAIEYDQNIIIVGKKSEVNRFFLSKLASFIPNYHRLLVVGSISAQMNCRFHFVSDSGRNSMPKLVNVIQNLDSVPDRVLCKEIEARNAREIFSIGTTGIGFITSFVGEVPEFINRIRAEPFNVSENEIINLDLVVQLGEKRIESINECRWLAKMNIGEHFKHDLSFKSIAKSTGLDYESLSDSKVLQKYSKVNLVGRNTARAELIRRAKFLSRFKGKLSYSRYVLSYREISTY